MTPQSHQYILDLLMKEWEEVLMDMQRHTQHGDETWNKLVQQAAKVHYAITEFRKLVNGKEATQ